MCYMSDQEKVGVRQLRQNLSKYLRRVIAGETLRVTDRGTPVALLAPLPEEATVLDRLAAEGRLARARLDLVALGAPPDHPRRMSISAALREQRAEA